MSDQSSSENEGGAETKLRISLVLSPSVRSASQRELLELPAEITSGGIAVPASVRKRGLSAVVNHLLDRRLPKEERDSGEDSDSDEEDDDKLPAIPFDFLLNDKLLRLPLESAVRKEGLSTERAIEVHYFPARPPPRREGESEALPDWITAMDFAGGALFAGGADGAVRAYSAAGGGGGELTQSSSVAAHTGPVKCLSALAGFGGDAGRTLVATGSMDQTLVTHVCRSGGGSMDLHAVYSGGHANSIGSVALSSRGGENAVLASGDWDGGLCVWSVPSSEHNDENQDSANTEAKSKKKRKGSGGANDAAAAPGVREVRPLQSIKAHSSNISGLEWGYGGGDGSSAPSTLITGSWDHGLKVYDASRMDCVLALNGSRVVTSLSRCSNSNVVATSSPDCTVRLWDMRTNGEGSGGAGGMDKSLRQR